jgi:hypothetical protein
MNEPVHFAKHIGKKCLHNEKEYILYGVTASHLLCLNGTPDPFPVAIDECKVIFNSKEDYKEGYIPSWLSVIRGENGEFIEPSDIIPPDAMEEFIVEKICKCAGITVEELRDESKTKKREFAQARQVHMTIRNLVLKKGESYSQTGAIYGKDHATTMHAIKVVTNALDGFNPDFRDRFIPVWKLVKKEFKVDGRLNLNWL